MSRLVSSWGKKVLFAQVIIPCCSPRVMQMALDSCLAKSHSPCDAILCLSCASGVKSAFMCSRGLPVVAALDTVGPRIIGSHEGLVAQTHCEGCGKCVLTYTAGICPVDGCTQKRKYGPCPKAPKTPGSCAVDPSRQCIWQAILAATGPDMQKGLAALQKREAAPANPIPAGFQPPDWTKTTFAWVLSRSKPFAWVINLLK